MAILYSADINKSLRFWRNLLGLRVQKGSIFGESNAVFIFASDEDSKPSIILHKTKDASSTSSRPNRYQFTFVCPLSQIQLLSLLAAREGHMIIRPLSTSVQVQIPSLILLSPDGNRVRFIPVEHAQPNMTAKATPGVISDVEAPRKEPPAEKEAPPTIPARQPLTTLIRTQLLSLTRLLSRINADEAAAGSETSLPLDLYRDSVLQANTAVDSLLARFSKSGVQGLREDLSAFRTAEKHMLESCASCLPDLEQLRDEGKKLLSALAETRRDSLQKDRALSDLQGAISKAEQAVVRHKTDLLSAEERVLQCSTLSDAVAEEMSLARQEMQVREEGIDCSLFMQLLTLMHDLFTQDVFQQVLDDAVDISLVQGSAQQSELSVATKRCNDLKTKLKASRDKENAAEEARQAAERQVMKVQDELDALEQQLPGIEAQAFAGLDQQLTICKSSANLVREAVRVMEDLAARVEVKGRDLLGRTGSAGWAARLGSMPRASRAPVPSDRPSALDPRQRGASRRGQPTWPAGERPPAHPAAGQGKEVRLAPRIFPHR
jgi:hypothetical protein